MNNYNPPPPPSYLPNNLDNYDDSFLKYPQKYNYEIRLENHIQKFNPNYHFDDFEKTNMHIKRDCCSFYKHKTQNIYLKYNGMEWEDITFIYQDLLDSRTNEQNNRQNIIQRLGLDN